MTLLEELLNYSVNVLIATYQKIARCVILENYLTLEFASANAFSLVALLPVIERLLAK